MKIIEKTWTRQFIASLLILASLGEGTLYNPVSLVCNPENAAVKVGDNITFVCDGGVLDVTSMKLTFTSSFNVSTLAVVKIVFGVGSLQLTDISLDFNSNNVCCIVTDNEDNHRISNCITIVVEETQNPTTSTFTLMDSTVAMPHTGRSSAGSSANSDIVRPGNKESTTELTNHLGYDRRTIGICVGVLGGVFITVVIVSIVIISCRHRNYIKSRCRAYVMHEQKKKEEEKEEKEVDPAQFGTDKFAESCEEKGNKRNAETVTSKMAIVPARIRPSTALSRLSDQDSPATSQVSVMETNKVFIAGAAEEVDVGNKFEDKKNKNAEEESCRLVKEPADDNGLEHSNEGQLGERPIQMEEGPPGLVVIEAEVHATETAEGSDAGDVFEDVGASGVTEVPSTKSDDDLELEHSDSDPVICQCVDQLSVATGGDEMVVVCGSPAAYLSLSKSDEDKAQDPCIMPNPLQLFKQ